MRLISHQSDSSLLNIYTVLQLTFLSNLGRSFTSVEKAHTFPLLVSFHEPARLFTVKHREQCYLITDTLSRNVHLPVHSMSKYYFNRLHCEFKTSLALGEKRNYHLCPTVDLHKNCLMNSKVKTHLMQIFEQNNSLQFQILLNDDQNNKKLK